MSGQVHAEPAKKQPSAATGILQRKCDGCKKKQPLQRKAMQDGPLEVPAIAQDVLISPGQPPHRATRAFMEPRSQHNFSQMPVHSRLQASIQAKLKANESPDGQGPFDTARQEGRRLLAHELTHMVQQSGGDEIDIAQNDKRHDLTPKYSDRLALAENGVRGLGLHLPAGPRALLEAQFGRRFANVRLHTDQRAGEAAQQLGAVAYTLGRDIAFGQGFYMPHTISGLRLLSHELTHVVQSQDAPVRPLRASEETVGIEPLEHEAEWASDALGRGPMAIRQRLVGRMPLCHPVYISAHGGPDYLKEAAEFHRKWGNTPVHTGVRSIEAVLRDLAGQSSIGRVTIVSHANPNLIQMQFLDGGPNQVLKSDWQVGTVAELVNLERHLAPPDMIDKVIEYVNNTEPQVLPRIGPVTDPVVRQFIWWVVDQIFAEKHPGFPSDQALRMRKVGEDHAKVYRAHLLSSGAQLSSAGSGRLTVTEKDLDAAERAVKAQALKWQWSKLASPATEEEKRRLREQEPRLKESPSADILRVMQKPDFLYNLTQVRGKISDTSLIEIQGCNAGADRSYLEGIMRFFGGANKKPQVTGPDWFQMFGHYGYTIIGEDEAKRQWSDRRVKAALAYWYPIITSKPRPRNPTDETLLNYLRGGHPLPLTVPGATTPPGRDRILMLNTQGRKAFLKWLSLHSYKLTEREIERQLFAGTDFGANVEGAVVDMLFEHIIGPTKMVFRPSKAEYDSHIKKVP